ncbi:MAG: hypothetical protein J2P40_12580, partial [Candidatus Dormibacteraeota bacterium]|nr:hypothetical protein [Candidatus Dormibacteraeota bacterium]MBO0762102.1 hypothetical protein [Candidatus Dormibacteraeota bacterium]
GWEAAPGWEAEPAGAEAWEPEGRVAESEVEVETEAAGPDREATWGEPEAAERGEFRAQTDEPDAPEASEEAEQAEPVHSRSQQRNERRN